MNKTSEPQDVPGEDDIARLARAVCDVLMEPPYIGRLAEAARGGREAQEELPPAPHDPQGPVPIGPYEILPDFSAVAWTSEVPDAAEWLDYEVEGMEPDGEDAHAMAPTPPRPRGPLVTRVRPEQQDQSAD